MGSNPQTFLVDIKSATNEQVKDAIEFIRKSFHFRYSDERLNAYDMQLNLMLKALSGAPIVTCPHCGYEFNYDDVPEVTYSQQVLELAAQYHRWITEDIVREEMNKLTPQIREQVIAILDTQKNAGC